MKTLIIYDSVTGNTEKVARAAANAVSGEVKVLHVDGVGPDDLNVNLLIVGSPTHAGKPTEKIQKLLNDLNNLDGVSVAAFDTRMSMWFVRVFGFAAGKIAEALKAKGGNLVAIPEGFFVSGKEGPLKEGEVERAASWARSISGST